MTSDTITAVASAPGQGAIAVIRLAGPQAHGIAGKLLSSESHFDMWPERQIVLANFCEASTGACLDQVTAVKFKSPRSFTGDDMVEIFCHGAPIIAQLLIRELTRHGARIAQPGEFTQRAFLNDKIDLLQAEAIGQLVKSRSEMAVKNAQRVLAGNLSRRLDQLKDKLIDLIARVESNIDFVEEEDVIMLEGPVILAECRQISEAIAYIQAGYQEGRFRMNGLRIVLAGPVNAGKSTLFNYLLKQDRALVSNQAGTTRDFLEGEITYQGYSVTFVDTAGLRGDFDEIEGAGIKRSKQQAHLADMVWLVWDVSEGLNEETELLYKQLNGIPVLWVGNKIEKVQALPAISRGESSFYISAQQGRGVEALLDATMHRLIDATGDPDEALITHERHWSCLERAGQFIQQASCLLDQQAPLDLVALELRESLDSLEELVGKVSRDDMLGHIFSRFCIGK